MIFKHHTEICSLLSQTWWHRFVVPVSSRSRRISPISGLAWATVWGLPAKRQGRTMGVQSCIQSSWEVEAEGSGLQGQPELQETGRQADKQTDRQTDGQCSKWWLMPVVSAHERLRREDGCKSEAMSWSNILSPKTPHKIDLQCTSIQAKEHCSPKQAQIVA